MINQARTATEIVEPVQFRADKTASGTYYKSLRHCFETAMLSLARPDLQRLQIFIDGQWCDSPTSRAVLNPASGELLGEVAQANLAQAEQAIAANKRAQADWAALGAAARAQVLRRWYDLVIQHKADLARIMTLEQGKPLRESLGEIDYAAAFISWFAEEATRAYGYNLPSGGDKRVQVIKQAVGVCAAITPWNFPAAMITRKVAAALAAGCTITVRPASQTPFSALALAVLAEEAGIPAGVFNVITGEAGEIGSLLASHADVDKLSFTGSTEVGRELLALASQTVKRVSMELGGNAPFLVLDDANIAQAVEGAIASKFRNAGQTCVCSNRFYVMDAIYDQFAEQLAARVKQLNVGNGLDDATDIGPLINSEAINKVEQHVSDAIGRGATLITGGNRIGQRWFAPTLLTEVAAEALICREETFGPVAALVRVHTVEEAVQLANNSIWGLAAYCYTESLSRSIYVSENLAAGMVGINTGLISNAAAPFGGIKQSGLGREGSALGIDEYLNVKTITIGNC